MTSSSSTRNNLFVLLIISLSISLFLSLLLIFGYENGIRKDGWFAPIIISLIWMSVVYMEDAKAVKKY